MITVFKRLLNRPRKEIIGFVLALLFIAVPSIINAEEFAIGDYYNTDNIEQLYLGETKLFPVKKPRRIVVGNPSIIDVNKVSEDTIMLITKAVGMTTFIYWDVFGEHPYRVRVLAEDMTETKRRVDKLISELRLQDIYTKSNDEEGKVLLLGYVRNQMEKDRVDSVLQSLKVKTLDLIQLKDEGVIEIEARVLELDKDATRTLGFDLPGAITMTEWPASTAVTGYAKAFHVSDWTRTAFTHTLNFLVQEGKARILSQPKLACLSGKEAELLVGGEKPIFTTAVQATAGSSTSVEYKEYGIKLNIKPTVMDKNRINVVLNIEVSEIGTAETLGTATAPTARAYPLQKRSISTELFLNDGQTLAIGGLIKQKREEDIAKTAGLGDIPIIGALFRRKTTRVGGGQGERGDVELFITLTPSIVSKAEASIENILAPQASGEIKGDFPDELNDYIRNIQTRIINAAYYPPDARELGWEGTVKLSFLVLNDGALKEATVSQSSGYKILDEAALDAVSRQAPFPSFPSQVVLRELKVEVPITYRKDN